MKTAERGCAVSRHSWTHRGAQVAPSRVRGALGSINQLVICVGIVAALVANVCVPAASWRSMFMLAVAPAAALGLGAPALLGLPELV